MAEPKKGVAYDFSLSLVDALNSPSFKVNPTIAAGDFQVSTDDSAFVNLTTLPVVTPAGSIVVKISLSASEMNGDKVVVKGVDLVGSEWDDVLVFIDVPEATVDDVEKIVRNRWEIDEVTGIATLYDNDSDTPLFTAQIYEDSAGLQVFRNFGTNRRNRLA